MRHHRRQCSQTRQNGRREGDQAAQGDADGQGSAQQLVSVLSVNRHAPGIALPDEFLNLFNQLAARHFELLSERALFLGHGSPLTLLKTD